MLSSHMYYILVICMQTAVRAHLVVYAFNFGLLGLKWPIFSTARSQGIGVIGVSESFGLEMLISRSSRLAYISISSRSVLILPVPRLSRVNDNAIFVSFGHTNPSTSRTRAQERANPV